MRNKIKFNSLNNTKPLLNCKQIEIDNQELQAQLLQQIEVARMQIHIITTLTPSNPIPNNNANPPPDAIKEDAIHQQIQNQPNEITGYHRKRSSSSFSSKLASTAGSQCWPSTATPVWQLAYQTQTLFEDWVINIQEEQKQILEQLILHQVKLEHENDLRQLIINYEQKIEEMKYTVFNKEVDITNDHVGKVLSERPLLQNLRSFSRGCVQKGNVTNFVQAIRRARAAYVQKLQENQQLAKTDNMISALEKKKELFSQNTQNKFNSDKQNIHKNKDINKTKEIKTHKTQAPKKIGAFNDPLFKKVSFILNKEHERQKWLKEEYFRMKEHLSQTCNENKRLGLEYKRMMKSMS